ncbi:RDD family protein [Streptomyces sp. G45]|uniref:RDD family protein n=1 Tax=Streptomyces sp. G45 TaxID=3406627 RepID=UPI003C28E530
MSELVTGEAVALELRPAKLPSRVLAVLIDMTVAWSLYLAVTLGLFAASASLDDAAAAAIAVATFVLVLVGVPIAVETLSHGRSLGKLACGLRVVRDDGGPIRFRHALVRGAVGVVEILLTFGVVACVASLASARGRRLGDVFAGTLVVRERVPAGQTGYIPAPPPWLTGRFADLDLSMVPDGLWLAIRQYLTRMGQLDPQVGWAMAERLAADVVARTGAPAPEGVPPAAFLAAVVQERQAREARKAFGGPGVGGAGVGGGAAGAAAAGGAGDPFGTQGSAPLTPSPYAPSPPPVPPAPSTSYTPPSTYAPPAEAAPARPSPPPPPAGPPAPPREAEPSRPATGFVPPA